jgi:hypothetical protein
MSLSKDALWNQLQRMYHDNKKLLEIIRMLTAQLQSANAHCTLGQRALSESNTQLANQKKKRTRKSVKLRSRFVTLPELEEDFNKHEAEQREKEKAEAEKQAKKKADDSARLTRIEHDITTKTFDALSSYRLKDDFIAIAGALGLSREGTVATLTSRIKEYIADPPNAHLANNPRFSALFGNGRTRARNATSATDNSTTISAAPIEIPPIPALPANSSHYSSREHPNDSNINSPDPRHEIPYNPPVHPTRSNIPASQQFSGHFTSHQHQVHLPHHGPHSSHSHEAFPAPYSHYNYNHIPYNTPRHTNQS